MCGISGIVSMKYSKEERRIMVARMMEYIKMRGPDEQIITAYGNSTFGFCRLAIRAVEKGKGSVEDGIEYIKSFDRVIIHERCIETIKEFSLYSYKEDPRSGDITSDIVDANNHCIDALRYALERCMKRREIDYSTWDMDSLANLYNN